RSVVMDSPLPLEVSWDETSITNLVETLDQLLADCTNDPACNAAFPDLKNRFLNYLQAKTDYPLEVQVENPTTGKQETVYLRGEDLINVFALSSTSTVMEVPLEIHKLLNGDLTSLKETLSGLFDGPGDGAGRGMRLSVWCAEEHPFNDPTKVEAEQVKYPFLKGLTPETIKAEVCEIWGVQAETAIENEPIVSDIPALIMNGQFDEVTPVKWGQAMQERLPNSFHMVFPGWKHAVTTNWSNPCGMEAANAFFNDPGKKPSLECFEKISKPIFSLE
ncbi:MAG: alpha/beta hydrolase, partial [Bacteroidota bacterium]